MSGSSVRPILNAWSRSIETFLFWIHLKKRHESSVSVGHDFTSVLWSFCTSTLVSCLWALSWCWTYLGYVVYMDKEQKKNPRHLHPFIQPFHKQDTNVHANAVIVNRSVLQGWLLCGVPHSFPCLHRLRCSQPQSRAHGGLGKWNTQVCMDATLLPLYAHILTSQAAELYVDFRCCQDIRTWSHYSHLTQPSDKYTFCNVCHVVCFNIPLTILWRDAKWSKIVSWSKSVLMIHLDIKKTECSIFSDLAIIFFPF